MKKHSNAVLDLSTTSLAFNAGIVEITIVAFDYFREDVSVFHEGVSVANLRKLGLGVSESTLDYYQKKGLSMLLERKGKLKTKLNQMLTFLNCHCLPTVHIWCDIAFDYLIIGNNFLATGFEMMPLRHSLFHDYPTMSRFKGWPYTPKEGVNGSYEQCLERIAYLKNGMTYDTQ